jgi:hypothetical protein
MHHAIGQAAVVSEQQQAAGVEIEAADGYPAPVLEPRQFDENAGATIGIVPGNNLAFRLVIDQHTRQTQPEFELHQFAIDANLVFWTDALTDMRRQAVDADTPGNDPFFEFAP